MLTRLNHKQWREERATVLPPFITAQELIDALEELDVNPAEVQLYGRFHHPSDNSSGICIHGRGK